MDIHRRNKKRALSLSDSDEDKVTDDASGSSNQRRSSRIFDKRHKKKFRLPSRDEIWKDIPTPKSSVKLHRLTPRKTVNNFTKVYNDYNFDDYEDTSDETSASETSESDTDLKRQKDHRIKNFHKRIKHQSSSSDEDSDSKVPQSSSGQLVCRLSETKESNSVDNRKQQDNDIRCEQSIENLDEILVALPTEEDAAESDNSDVISPPKKSFRNQRSVLESDDDDTGTDGDGDDGSVKEVESSEDSDSSDQKKSRSERLKMKQTDLFKALREAHAKGKGLNKSHQTTT